MKYLYDEIKKFENIENINQDFMDIFLSCQRSDKESQYYYVLFSIEDIYWLAVRYGVEFDFFHRSNVEYVKFVVEQYDKKLIERFYLIEGNKIEQRQRQEPYLRPENVAFIRFKDAFHIFSILIKEKYYENKRRNEKESVKIA